jgi:hypothetical protein
MTDISAFQNESYRIDQQIWDTIALGPGERALFVGLANDGAWIKRAVEIGVDATVVGDDATILRIEALGATAIRGSATMVPASENAYDVAVAMHYLHEIDPGFHAHVVSELARVARRVVIVEPSPPADPLGKRIAALYGRAKREAGQFETYQTIDYWRKLLSIVKADVWQQLITFTRVPAKAAVNETIALILDALAIEEMPERYLDELRALAARSDAQLLPLSRIVLVGTAAGEPLPTSSAEPFRPEHKPPARAGTPAPLPAVTASAPQQQLPPAAPPYQPAPQAAPAWTPVGFGFGSEPEAPELPPPPPPPEAAAIPAELLGPARTITLTPQPPSPTPPAGQPGAAPAVPFGTPFALPDADADPPFGGMPPAEGRTGFGWSWEPPDDPVV